MLMRYHWGLDVGHTYSHIWDSAAEKVNEIASTSCAYADRFNDLINELTISEFDGLEWQLPEAESRGSSNWSTEDMSDLTVDDTDPPLIHGFEDFGGSHLLAGIEALEWEMPVDDDGDISENDGKSNDGLDASIMYI